MSPLEISNNEIMAIATNKAVYSHGLAYYMAQRVKDFVFDPETGVASATVKGSELYRVLVGLNKNSTIRQYQCTCPAYNLYPGACKHIVAVLKTLQLRMNPAKIKREAKERATSELLSFFAAQRQDLPKEEINLSVELDIVRMSGKAAGRLQLKVGQQRLYVVKSIGEFLRRIRDGRSLEFGKQFHYDPSRHTFREEDRPLIAMLLEILEQYEALEEMSSFYYQERIFNQRDLWLKGSNMKRLLDALGDKEYSQGNNTGSPGSNSSRTATISREGLPLEFSLRTEAQDLALVLETDEWPLQLTPDGSYYLYKDRIYQASPAQKESLPSLLKAYEQGFSNDILLPAARKEFFVSEALPRIEKVGKVKIEPELARKFRRQDLVSKIYFDRSDTDGIRARVEFHYGETVINPFAGTMASAMASASAAGTSTQATGEIILIRAVEQERKILSILEQAEFSVHQGRIHLEDDEQIYDFIMSYLTPLQELAELYYSDEFKLTVRSSTSFSGRVRLDENLDLLEVSFEYSDIDQGELGDIFRSLRLKKKYYRLRDGSFLNLEQPELEQFAKLADTLNLKADDLNQKVFKLPKYRALYIDNFLRQASLPGIQRNKAFKHLVQSILEPQDAEYEVPSILQTVLREYQRTGFKWLKTLAAYGLGGILADDMGLGKTLQVLAFIQSEKEASPGSLSAPALVIAPTSLVYNWQEEAKKFVPGLKVLVVDGKPQMRQELLAGCRDWDLVVTSYPMLRRDIEHYAKLEFSCCFLDEAQHIKNPGTINAKSVQRLQAKGYFALTGTPIENSLSELWSIFNFIMPGYLLSHQEFQKKYELPIVKGTDAEPLIELSRQVNPFILRRLKKDVLKELPDKIETKLQAQMTTEQSKIYLAFWQEARKNLAQEIKTAGFEKSQIKILAALTRLRQICSHPGMFVEGYTGESGKMQLFQEILADALDGGHRILVFSQFTSMLDIIQHHLDAEKIEHFYLRGSTKASERAEMVQAFNAGAGKVFLISLKAGGTGLNLTGADMVIHYDPWWNPAVEEQATDRAHRIGQKKAVQVIKLVTQGTIEEKVYALQEKKKELIEAVIQPGETMLSKLTEEELRELFEMR